MLIENDGYFECSVCGSRLTIFSENGGKGFRARCKECKVNYFYPTCDECEQPTWRHDEEKHDSIVATKAGKAYCRTCKMTKELELFNIKNDKPSSRCKRCQSDYFYDWYHKKQKKERDGSATNEEVLDELFGF